MKEFLRKVVLKSGMGHKGGHAPSNYSYVYYALWEIKKTSDYLELLELPASCDAATDLAAISDNWRLM